MKNVPEQIEKYKKKKYYLNATKLLVSTGEQSLKISQISVIKFQIKLRFTVYLIIQFSNLMNYVMNKYFLFLQVHSDCNITICEFSLEEVIFKFLSLPRK